MYAIYGDIYHQYTPNVSIYTIHGSYGIGKIGRNIGKLKNMRELGRNFRNMNVREDVKGLVVVNPLHWEREIVG